MECGDTLCVEVYMYSACMCVTVVVVSVCVYLSMTLHGRVTLKGKSS